MKVWKLIVIITLFLPIIVVLINYFDEDKKPKPIPFERNNSDSLYKVIDSLKSKEDSLVTEIKTLEKNKQKVIIKYYEKDNNIRTFNADRSIRLFGEWNRQLQDSSYQTRYFRISTDTVHSQLK